ncbi:MAG: DUF6635 family protein [Pseudomonadota bacterium]
MDRRPDDATRQAIEAAHGRLDAFVHAHFGLRGTLRLHRAALGWDLLRAPANVALAPVFLLVRLAGLILRLIGLRRAGTWLGTRRILLPTAVARRVAGHVADDLLADLDLGPRGRALIADYAGIRSAVAEITTALVVLAAGIALFGTATPGIVSLAPQISDRVAQAAAISDFWLGSWFGARWYGLFPVALPVWAVVAIFVALAMVASLVTTFAGILADPVQTRLGVHRRRLRRLLARIAAAEGAGTGIAPEHILARLADLTDAGLSLIRVFRP